MMEKEANKQLKNPNPTQPKIPQIIPQPQNQTKPKTKHQDNHTTMHPAKTLQHHWLSHKEDNT